MKTPNYQPLNLEQLFEALESVATNSYDAILKRESLKRQNEWIDNQNALQEEIQARGDDALQRYVPLLTAKHPAVRSAAALGLRGIAPALAAPVLQELANGRYGASLSLDASTTLSAMRAEGVIPPEQ